MLSSLHIENIAVIERADIAFHAGFNVLTGETGAGKSILIDSLYAVLGGRTGKELVRTDSADGRALVSAVFDAAEGSEAALWCEQNDIFPEDGCLIIQRVIARDGHGSCRVNGQPITVSQLRALGSTLVDIHGQNDGRLLLDEKKHLSYLDLYGDFDSLLSDYKATWQQYTAKKKDWERLNLDEETRLALCDTLSLRVRELLDAAITAGEEDALEKKSELLVHAERLRDDASEAYAALYGDGSSAYTQCGRASGVLAHSAGRSEELAQALQTVNEAAALLYDAGERVRDFLDTLDFPPDEVDRVQGRLALFRRLEKKYHTADADSLLTLCEQSEKRLDEMESSADIMARLKKECDALYDACRAKAARLSDARRKSAASLSALIEKELKDLSMPSVRFVAEVQPAEAPGPDGADSVRFLISANAGQEPGPIAKIASGGELSRIMLALKTVFGRSDPVATAVFDEIDTGVSGVAASRVADKLSLIGRQKQILCITHLPQIAAMADEQYEIRKQERDGHTFTEVIPLDREGRIRELSRLIGGEDIAAETLASAAHLLESAAVKKTDIK